MATVTVIGAGLAGCEAALQVRRLGVAVRLLEMRPERMTEAHETANVAELVCSNSLKSEEAGNAHGLLKAELRLLGSRLLCCADAARIPGGKALVVDRQRFSAAVQAELDAAGVLVERVEAEELPGDEGVTVVATGPLTSSALASALSRLLGTEHLFFYDAIAPVVAADSLDRARVFSGSRYDAGSDYLNCPMDEPEYGRFIEALLGAELHPLHEFEAGHFFEGCLPIEEMARRGRLVPAFGPMKPVGLTDPRTGVRPFAVVQLRRENAAGTMYNLVGFQTRLRHSEQERVLRLIPGLGRARFLRFGTMHRNTFIDAPKCLRATLQAQVSERLLVAGQLTGVEGYVESIGAGLVAGLNAARIALGSEPLVLPPETMLGALLSYITTPSPDFQPMNANFGLLPSCPGRGRERRAAQSERALAATRTLAGSAGLD
jgi:methylenetetrahydrofolate--tRNA-(uracil-5-)-methyltransferase